MYSTLSFQGLNTKDDSIMVKQLSIQCKEVNVYSILKKYYKSNLRVDVFGKVKQYRFNN